MNRMVPKTMRISSLTAALQMPYGRRPFLADRIGGAKQALQWWAEVCGRQAIGMQLACAHHLQDGTKPPEEMMDPVACHGLLYTRQDGSGVDLSPQDADWTAEVCQKNGGVKIYDVAYFDNLMDPNPKHMAQNHAHALRVGRSAVLYRERGLGTSGITLFVGRNPLLDLDQNLDFFWKHVIPLWRKLIEQGNEIYIENCPMWGWNTTDAVVNNLANSPGMWIILLEMAKLAGLDISKIHFTYDYSHTGLQRGRRGWTFRAMKEAGLAGNVSRFHGKDLIHDNELTAIWDAHGQIVLKEDRLDGVPTAAGNAWAQYTGRHAQLGFKHPNRGSEQLGREEDWHMHQFEARTVLGLDPEKTVFHLELEDPYLRVKIRDEADTDGPADSAETMQQKRDFLEMVVGISARYIYHIDAAADMQVQALKLMAQHKIVPPNKAPVEELDIARMHGLIGTYRERAGAVCRRLAA